MTFKKLSILIPVYCEVKTVREILERVLKADIGDIEKEIIVVDDGSTDGTCNVLKEVEFLSQHPHRLIFHAKNMGKGAAVRTALNYATGDIILIQDADLEYDPSEYRKLLTPIIDGRADVVYGSRLSRGEPARNFLFWHYVGNKFLSLLTNILYNATITDMETCYKVFRADVIKKIRIKSNRFDFEPEITAKILKRRHHIYEFPISYSSRDYSGGKKIKWQDGFIAIWTLFKYRFID